MSTQRGNTSRTRAQKHKNHFAFRNDLHDKTPQQMRINSLNISEVCQHCKAVIEWKIKYKTFKPLSQAKTCTRCHQRTIRKAYHTLCRDCAREMHVCPKCGKSADEVEIEPPSPTPAEELKLKVEMDRLIKSFPERKRRAFLRYMKQGKRVEEEVEEQSVDGAPGDGVQEREGDDKETVKVPKRIPHTREELLQRIKKLNLLEDGGDDGSEDGCSDSDSDNCGHSDNNDDSEETS